MSTGWLKMRGRSLDCELGAAAAEGGGEIP